MTDLVTVIVLGCAVLVILGGLIGHSMSERLRAEQIRRQAAVQRRIGEQWRELRTGRPATCGRCGGTLEMDLDEDLLD
jgi:hypothetical protein